MFLRLRMETLFLRLRMETLFRRLRIALFLRLALRDFFQAILVSIFTREKNKAQGRNGTQLDEEDLQRDRLQLFLYLLFGLCCVCRDLSSWLCKPLLFCQEDA